MVTEVAADLAEASLGKVVEWTVKDGVLTAGKQRGILLISEKERPVLHPRALKISPTEAVEQRERRLVRPSEGRSLAFDGMEMQVADLRP